MPSVGENEEENTNAENRNVDKIHSGIGMVRETKRELRVYYTNARSVRNKIEELKCLACTEKLDIILISETWININNKDLAADYSIEGMYNNDRLDGRRDGVLIYMK